MVKIEPVKKQNIKLEISHEVAKTIRLLAGSVTGSPSKSRRKYTDELYYALDPIVGNNAFDSMKKYISHRGIEFLNEEGIEE